MPLRVYKKSVKWQIRIKEKEQSMMFTGSMVAMVTPFDENGQIAQQDIQQLVDYHVAQGTQAIVAVGTTGESATLTEQEHLSVVQMTVEASAGRIAVIAGAGANSTAKAVRLNEKLANSGVVGCLSVTPYYNRPTQEGLYQHYKTIAEHTDLPQILYNVPSRTGCDLLPETVARLAEFSNIVAIKEATGNVSRVSQLRALISDRSFSLLSGDDATGLDFMQLGGNGVISVTANIAAKAMATICRLVVQREFDQARALNQQLMPLHRGLFIESNPTPVKWACWRLGLIGHETMRLPLLPLSQTAQPIIHQQLQQAGLL